jgi:low affinity Fe/Cu permease
VLAEAQQNPARVDQLVSAALGTVPSQVAGRIQAHLGEVVAARVAAGTMRAMPLRQLLVNVIGLAVFPFIAQPLLRNALQLDDAAFNAFLDERSRELPGFIINALRP